MLMLLCATTAMARMRLGASVGCSANSCRLGTRHRSVRCSSETTSTQGGDAKGGDDERLMTWFAENGGSGTVAVAAQGGLRGLVVTRDVQVGDVLLDVPLSATLLDFCEQGSPLPGAAPPWSASLPSKVQLALLVLRERERERGPWAPFLLAWPSDAPALPESLDDTTLAREAHDPA